MEEKIIPVSGEEEQAIPAEENTEIKDEGENAPDEEVLPYTDYDALAKKDLEELQAQFPELSGITSITMIENPLRYAALRDLGLSAREAYLATGSRGIRYDNRSHLSSAVPGGAAAPRSAMSSAELEAARELFGKLSDRDIQKLYKKVTR